MSDFDLHSCLNGVNLPKLKFLQSDVPVVKRYDLDSFFFLQRQSICGPPIWCNYNVFDGFQFSFAAPYVQKLSPVDCRSSKFTHFLTCAHAKHPDFPVPANFGILFGIETDIECAETAFSTFLLSRLKCYQISSSSPPPIPFACLKEFRLAMQKVYESNRVTFPTADDFQKTSWLGLPSSLLLTKSDLFAMQLVSGKWIFHDAERLIEFVLGMQDHGVVNRVEAAIEYSSDQAFLSPSWSNHRDFLYALGPLPPGMVPQQYCFFACEDICGITLQGHSRSYFPALRRLISPSELHPRKKLTRLPEFIRAISPANPNRDSTIMSDIEKASTTLHELFYEWKKFNHQLSNPDFCSSVMPLRIELQTSLTETPVSVCKRFFSLAHQELVSENQLLHPFTMESLLQLSETILFWVSETLRQLFRTDPQRRMVVSILPGFLQRRCAITVFESLKCILGGMEKADYLVQSYHFHHITRPSCMNSALFICKDTLLCHPRDCDYEGSLYRSAFSMRKSRMKKLRRSASTTTFDGIDVAMVLRCVASLEILHDCIFLDEDDDEDETIETDNRSLYADDWVDLENCLLGLLVRQALHGLHSIHSLSNVQLAVKNLMTKYSWNFETIGPSFCGVPPGLQLSAVLDNFSELDWEKLKTTPPIFLKDWALQQPVIQLLLSTIQEFDLQTSRNMEQLLLDSLSSAESVFLRAIPVVAVSRSRYRKTKINSYLCPIFGALKYWQTSSSDKISETFPTSLHELEPSQWILPWLPISLSSASEIIDRNGYERIDYKLISSHDDLKQIPVIDFISVCWATALTSVDSFLECISNNLGRNLISAKRTNWQFFLHLRLFPFAWRSSETPEYHVRISPKTLRSIGRKVSKLLIALKDSSSNLSKSEQFSCDVLRAFSSTDESAQVSLTGFHSSALLKSFSIWRQMSDPPPLTPYGYVHDCLLPAMESCGLSNSLAFKKITKDIYCRSWNWHLVYPYCEDRPFGHGKNCPLYREQN